MRAATEAGRAVEKLEQLRGELVELAYTLELRGQLDAADVAMTTAARVGEICDELTEPRIIGDS